MRNRASRRKPNRHPQISLPMYPQQPGREGIQETDTYVPRYARVWLRRAADVIGWDGWHDAGLTCIRPAVKGSLLPAQTGPARSVYRSDIALGALESLETRLGKVGSAVWRYPAIQLSSSPVIFPVLEYPSKGRF
ncbi:predicted protein [Histoplasma capsulatum var. duboisii H88]|uniref:Predicted protein n=1 Tax=Ajellomyces capsulatus (strain H88) TaxID=544711 RepID=F0UHJ1_AJEC8|nr:predicted protein [Histoplasma capsulatum var. duboisii H88]